jgi:hypothetical protein
MNDEIEDVIDALLREQFEGPVPADGFCDEVMERLPARRRHFRWPLAAGVVAGVAMCWFSLWSAPIMYIGWQEWISGELSASAIALLFSIMSMAVLALAWTIAEADDRYAPSVRHPLGSWLPRGPKSTGRRLCGRTNLNLEENLLQLDKANMEKWADYVHLMGAPLSPVLIRCAQYFLCCDAA